MNKYLFIKKFFQIIISSVLICSVLAFIAIFQYKSKLYDEFLKNKKSELEVLVQLTYNDILIGNYKNFRQRISSAIEAKVFNAYYLSDKQQLNVEKFPEDYFLDDASKKDTFIEIPIYFSNTNEQWGNIKFYYDNSTLKTVVSNFNLFAIFIIFICILTIIFGFIYYFKIVKNWTTEYSESFESILKNTITPNIDLTNPWYPAILSYYELKMISLKNEDEINKLKQETVLAEQAKQVAHDIRSPLTALNLVIAVLKDIPEEQRHMIRSAINRITDIANTLLEKGKFTNINLNEKNKINNLAPSETKKDNEPEYLEPILSSIISEKRIQFRDKKNIVIHSDFKDCYGAFLNIDAIELSRVISNLINNSIEAFENETGQITLSLRVYEKQILLVITDNGKGIPSHILNQLGNKGFSFGKENSESGSGLGIYHAKKTIEAASGKFTIHSKEGEGTIINLQFPKAIAPQWFLPYLNLTNIETVVTVDDDISIHQIWRQRIDNEIKNENIKLVEFTSINEFKKWFKTNNSYIDCIFLVDYELLQQGQNGIEIIEELNIYSNSILVTSRFDEKKIQEKCIELKIKLLPKTMSNSIPFKV